jgi:AraC family transcriptional regulator
MPVAGRGRILVWEGASLWVLEGAGDHAQTDFHSHHAIQVTLALEGDFELRAAGERLAGPAVAVAPDASHVFTAAGRIAFLFVEPESAAGQALMAAAFRGRALAALPERALAPHLAALSTAFAANQDDDALMRIGREIVSALAGSAERPAAPDHRVQAMLTYAGANLEAPLSLPAAASAACLSPSRARHLFVAQTGLPFKTYILWLRIKRAVEIYAGGASLTEAAHEAGFADSAHFSRTFRRTFGVPAASLRVNSRFVQAEAGQRS